MDGAVPANLTEFDVEALRLCWSAEERLTPRQVWDRMRPGLREGKTLADVKSALVRLEEGYRHFERRLSKKRVFITHGEHAMERGTLIGPLYPTRSIPPLFLKYEVRTVRHVADIKLDSGVVLHRVPEDDFMREEEIAQRCCFGQLCLGTGMYTDGRWADPVQCNRLCCEHCFVARVDPQRRLLESNY